MTLPDSAVSKGIRRPDRAAAWVKRQATRYVEREIVTPVCGRYLYDHDWDLAVVLDACRYDLGARVASEHSIGLGEPERVYSVGSQSPHWIQRTFEAATDAEIERTAYITANAHTDKAPKHRLTLLDDVWRYAWDDEYQTVLPRPVTDRAIEAMRNDVADRYIVHYMQPHLPSVVERSEHVGGWVPYEGKPGKGDAGGEWEAAQNGYAEEVTEAYENNLGPVLDDLDLLLENVDAPSVVVTADHGNYLGEGGRWGHPPWHMRFPVRHVPWWETTASDEQTHSPAEYDRSADGGTRNERLEALGYK